MGKPSGYTRTSNWKAWLCGGVILAAALNGASAGAASPTVPGAPTITSVKGQISAITVSFNAPASNGGARILTYRAVCTSSNGGATGSHNGTKSPVKVPSLTSGKKYTCTVTAANNVGSGDASEPSALVVALPTVPSAPSITSVKAVGLRTITIGFTKPASDGRAAITNYKAACTSSNGGRASSRVGHSSPISVASLTADHTYTCTVAANNRIGPGKPSAASSPVVALPTVPGPPTISSAKAVGVRSVAVSFNKPVDNGGAPIQNYRAECKSSNGGTTRSKVAHHSPITVAGMTTGKTYRCTVEGSNGVRYSKPSLPSNQVVVRAH